LAEWELHIDSFRVFFDILREDMMVKVVAIGEKRGNELYSRGEKYEL
jgi:hypothetical protein